MQKLIPTILKITGLVLILVGFLAAYYGPLEIFVFYFFSEGGQFYYEGFGVGSFWFAVLIVLNLGYYIIAALFIPIGYGHLKLRRWALTLTQLSLSFWVGAGVLLSGSFIFLIPSILKLDQDLNELILQVITVGMFLLVGLILLPVVGLWFYRSERVKSSFGEQDPHIYWTERYPFSLLALLILYVTMILVLHLDMFFQCVFPMFGTILLGRPSVRVISACIFILGFLIYGIVRLEKWAWWGSVIYVSLLAISSLMSFSRYSFYDIVQMMDLPAYEMEILGRLVVLHDAHLTGLIFIPLATALGLLVFSKRYFGKDMSLERRMPANPSFR